MFYREQEGELYLSRLAVVPAWRGRGVATRLLETVCEFGRACGLAAATVGVRLQLPDNVGFFAAHGFRPYDLGTHQGFRGPTFLRMRRPLRDE